MSGDPITGWKPVPLFGSGLGKQFGAQVALAGAGENHYDEPALVFGPGGHRERRKDRGPGGDAAEDALLPGYLAGGVEGRLVAHRDDFVNDPGIEDLGDEAGADALDLMGAGWAAGEHRRGRGLHRHRLKRGLAGLDHFGHPG